MNWLVILSFIAKHMWHVLKTRVGPPLKSSEWNTKAWNSALAKQRLRFEPFYNAKGNKSKPSPFNSFSFVFMAYILFNAEFVLKSTGNEWKLICFANLNDTMFIFKENCAHANWSCYDAVEERRIREVFSWKQLSLAHVVVNKSIIHGFCVFVNFLTRESQLGSLIPSVNGHCHCRTRALVHRSRGERACLVLSETSSKSHESRRNESQSPSFKYFQDVICDCCRCWIVG